MKRFVCEYCERDFPKERGLIVHKALKHRNEHAQAVRDSLVDIGGEESKEPPKPRDSFDLLINDILSDPHIPASHRIEYGNRILNLVSELKDPIK